MTIVEMTKSEQEIGAIKTISAKIYQQAEQYDFPLSPKSYLVWYDYFEGKNPMLNDAVNGMMEKQLPFTHDAIMDLYARFLDRDSKEIMTQVQRETRRILTDMLEGMLSISNASNEYEKKLSGYSMDLSQAADITKVREIVGSIITDTKKMADTNQELQDEFEKAKRQTETMNQKLNEIETIASTDALTGLYNRRTFDKEIQNLVETYKKTDEPFSVIVLDIDHFKRFNDTYGHTIGDEVLKTVGSVLKKGVKGRDMPTRYGGEEFVILLPETTCKNACILAEHLRIRIAVRPLRDPHTRQEIAKITASFGVAEVNPQDDAVSIIERADRALYAAKEAGRNRTKSEMDLV